uniref:Ig-like domain-containing protein n=1 Tax=Trichogramma kaykai TaxID=54128 RepID=A0ABD2VUD4_9HYME
MTRNQVQKRTGLVTTSVATRRCDNRYYGSRTTIGRSQPVIFIGILLFSVALGQPLSLETSSLTQPTATLTQEASPSTSTSSSTTTSTTTPTTTTTTTTPSPPATVQASSDKNEPEGHSMDDLMPGSTQEPPTPSTQGPLVFVDQPSHTETELGASVLLACRTATPVVECRWSWQPLPPTHLPLPNIDNSSPISNDVALNATTGSPATSLALKTFPAFGNASNDCSVRFSSTKYEQTGYWTCAARQAHEETFTSTPPAKLNIVHLGNAGQIKFVPQDAALEIPSGATVRLSCNSLTPVRECQWSWRQLNQSQPWDVEMRRFPAAGNDSTNCELGLPAARSEHEGFWTCGARQSPNSPFVQAPAMRLLISEVEFVRLLRDIQITVGESVYLRCLVNKPVYQCEWSWRPSNTSKNSTVARKFAPPKEMDHDCSVRLQNILYEEEGVWTCGVRLTPAGILLMAPSTTVTLLPSGKVNFTETPKDVSTPRGSQTSLSCASNGRVESCAWSWRPLNSPPDTETKTLRFPSHGDLGRNCSLKLTNLSLDDEGHWTCRIYLGGVNVLTSPPAKITVYLEGALISPPSFPPLGITDINDTEDVVFSELSKDISVSSGGTVSLRCVTSARVEQCRWALNQVVGSNNTVVVKLFPPAGLEGRDCSVKLSHALAEQEGLWTCGARMHARQNYTDAPPARLRVIEPDPTMVTIWGTPHQMINLACKTGANLDSRCYWLHEGSELRLAEAPGNDTRKTKHTVSMNHTSGVCSLQFTADERDFGEWHCEFVIYNEQVQSRLGSAFILLLSNPPVDQRLSWLVGAITSTVLFLLIIAVVVVVCKTRICARKLPTFLETLPADEAHKDHQQVHQHHRVHQQQQQQHASADRYVLGPLSYVNPNFVAHSSSSATAGAAETDLSSGILPNRSPHLYERVGGRRGVVQHAPKTYENVVYAE